MPAAPNPITIEQSHGRARVMVRDTPPLPAAHSDEGNRTPLGKFGPGNTAAARRALKRAAKGIATLDPASCAPWLAPHVRAATEHGLMLAERFDDPVLSALCGAAADALAMFRGLMTLAAQGDEKARTEARGWARELRAFHVDLCALATNTKPERDPYQGPRTIADLAATLAAEDVPRLNANANTAGRTGLDLFNEHDPAPEAPTKE